MLYNSSNNVLCMYLQKKELQLISPAGLTFSLTGTHLFLYVFHVYFGWLATQSIPPPLLDLPLEYHHQNALTEKV